MRSGAGVLSALWISALWGARLPARHRWYFLWKPLPDYNARFAKPPVNKTDLHRRLRAGDDLEDAFARKEERTLSQALTLQYGKVIFILEPSDQAKPAPGREQGAAIGKRVTVIDHPDGRLSIRYQGVELVYRTFDERDCRPQAAVRGVGDDPR